MMLPTHVSVGLALATPVVGLVPELATPVIVGALVGSVLPDADILAKHRRTLHYPTGYAIAAPPTTALAIVSPAPVTAALAAGVVAAAVHCRMDRYGGSYEFRPWERKSDRAVYDHVRGRWLRAKRWTRYDGAPADLLVATIAAIVPIVVLDGAVRIFAVGVLAVGICYTVFRRQLSDIVATVFVRLRVERERLRAGCGRR